MKKWTDRAVCAQRKMACCCADIIFRQLGNLSRLELLNMKVAKMMIIIGSHWTTD